MGFSMLEKVLIAACAVLFVTLIIIIAVWASSDSDSDTSDTASVSDNTLKAICQMKEQSLNNVTGVVTFEQKSGQDINISVNLSGVPVGTNTNNSHGFHVHYYGDISTCKATGGHYNPDSVDHAGPTDDVRHPGDFGNLVQDGSGNIVKSFTDPKASLFGEQSIIGRSIVLHAGRDDLGQGTGSKEATSKASGNAGARLACCVIGRVKT